MASYYIALNNCSIEPLKPVWAGYIHSFPVTTLRTARRRLWPHRQSVMESESIYGRHINSHVGCIYTLALYQFMQERQHVRFYLECMCIIYMCVCVCVHSFSVCFPHVTLQRPVPLVLKAPYIWHITGQ